MLAHRTTTVHPSPLPTPASKHQRRRPHVRNLILLVSDWSSMFCHNVLVSPRYPRPRPPPSCCEEECRCDFVSEASANVCGSITLHLATRLNWVGVLCSTEVKAVHGRCGWGEQPGGVHHRPCAHSPPSPQTQTQE